MDVVDVWGDVVVGPPRGLGPPTPADGPEAVGGGPPPGGELVIPVFAAGFSFRTTGVDGLVLIGPVGPGALADGVVDAGGAGAVVSIGGLGRDVTGAARPVVDGAARAGPTAFEPVAGALAVVGTGPGDAVKGAGAGVTPTGAGVDEIV